MVLKDAREIANAERDRRMNSKLPNLDDVIEYLTDALQEPAVMFRRAFRVVPSRPRRPKER